MKPPSQLQPIATTLLILFIYVAVIYFISHFAHWNFWFLFSIVPFLTFSMIVWSMTLDENSGAESSYHEQAGK